MPPPPVAAAKQIGTKMRVATAVTGCGRTWLQCLSHAVGKWFALNKAATALLELRGLPFCPESRDK